MKESIAAVAIIISVIFVCIYTTVFTSHFCEDMKKSTTNCMDAAQQSDWNSASRHIDDIKILFDEKDSKLETFIMHQDLNEVHDTILKIDAAIKLKSRDVCISESNYLIGQLDRIASSDSLSFANIL